MPYTTLQVPGDAPAPQPVPVKTRQRSHTLAGAPRLEVRRQKSDSFFTNQAMGQRINQNNNRRPSFDSRSIVGPNYSKARSTSTTQTYTSSLAHNDGYHTDESSTPSYDYNGYDGYSAAHHEPQWEDNKRSSSLPVQDAQQQPSAPSHLTAYPASRLSASPTSFVPTSSHAHQNRSQNSYNSSFYSSQDSISPSSPHPPKTPREFYAPAEYSNAEPGSSYASQRPQLQARTPQSAHPSSYNVPRSAPPTKSLHFPPSPHSSTGNISSHSNDSSQPPRSPSHSSEFVHSRNPSSASGISSHSNHSNKLHMPSFNLSNPPRRGSALFFHKKQNRGEDINDTGIDFINPRAPPTPDEDGDERDDYGFRKISQWLSVDDHHDFESFYKPIQERRAQKWQQLLFEQNGQWPERSIKLKRYVRKGVPPYIRGRVWFHYSGAEAKMQANTDVYKQLCRQAEEKGQANEFAEIIERDLHRTFPENIRFKSTTDNADGSKTLEPENVPAIKSLRRVLVAFSLYAPQIGYCQSLNYIAGLMLLFMDEEEAFWMLVVTVLDFLPEGMYDVTMEGANIDQSVLMMFIMEKLPSVWAKLSNGKGFWEVEDGDGSMPTVTLVTSHWFLTLFINILPIESVLRVWDCLFYEGHKVLFRIALTIFKMNEANILAVNDPLEVFQVVQNMPKRMLNCHILMDTAFNRAGKKFDITRKEVDDWRDFFRQRRKQNRVSGNPSTGGTIKRPKNKKKIMAGVVDRAKTVKL